MTGKRRAEASSTGAVGTGLARRVPRRAAHRAARTGAGLGSLLVRRALGLPPVTTPDVEVRRGLRVPMPDGVTLVADLYRPRGAGPLPTVVVRSPYGRAGAYALLNARILAERGLQVLLQSTRGTFGSGGEFEPFRERDDGLATLAWIREQPWHDGPLGTTGLSYLGIVQWAVAADADDLAAMTVAVTASEFRSQTYAGGSFSLDTALAWTQLVELQERPLGLLRHVLRIGRLRRAMNHLPLADADRRLLGHHVRFYQAWLEHDAPGDPYWAERSYHDRVEEIGAVADLVGGWYDIFLPWQVRDFQRLRAAGRDARLTIGPWAHTSPGLLATAARNAVRILRAELAGDREAAPGAPVRVYVTGAREWRELPDWPPADASPQRWHLQPGRGLSPAPPRASTPDRYRYDPADPTPALSGPVLLGRATPVDNAPLEIRPDVLTYTSAALERPLEIGGPVTAEIHLRSSRPHTDVFVRICDVDRRDVSRNVCDGLWRVHPGHPEAAPDGSIRVEVQLWPAAHRFEPGHRIRVQVSSGAHPRFARNTGSGEPLGTATTLIAADQAVFHDPEHPSAVVLPVRA